MSWILHSRKLRHWHLMRKIGHIPDRATPPLFPPLLLRPVSRLMPRLFHIPHIQSFTKSCLFALLNTSQICPLLFYPCHRSHCPYYCGFFLHYSILRFLASVHPRCCDDNRTIGPCRLLHPGESQSSQHRIQGPSSSGLASLYGHLFLLPSSCTKVILPLHASEPSAVGSLCLECPSLPSLQGKVLVSL